MSFFGSLLRVSVRPPILGIKALLGHQIQQLRDKEAAQRAQQESAAVAAAAAAADAERLRQAQAAADAQAAELESIRARAAAAEAAATAAAAEVARGTAEAWELQEAAVQRGDADLVSLARDVVQLPLDGHNIVVMGLTDVGKSTIVNRLVGRQAAEVGAGEVTLEVQSYADALGNRIWDMPGRNDGVSYSTRSFIALWKAAQQRVVVVDSTFRSMAHTIRLLQALHLSMVLVVNRVDRIDDDGQPLEQFQAQIREEAAALSPGAPVFFLAANSQESRFALEWNRFVVAVAP